MLIQKLSGLSYYAKVALAVLAYQAIFITCFELVVFFKHVEIVEFLDGVRGNSSLAGNQPSDTINKEYAYARSMSVYHVLFIVAQVFQFGIYVDALYNQNTIQIIALSLFDFGILAYSIIQVNQSLQLVTVGNLVPGFNGGSVLPYEIAIIVQVTILTMVFAFIAYKLYQEFGWSIYKKIGADMAMRDRYKMYQIFIMLLKFDLFFFVGLSVQILVLLIFISNGPVGDIMLHILLSSITSVTMLICAFWGVKTENKLMMYSFMIGCLGTEAYFIRKIVDISAHPELYFGTRIFATFFVCICMFLGVVTLIISVLCFRNFGHGLKQHISRDQNKQSEVENQFSTESNDFNLESVRGNTIHRWSID